MSAHINSICTRITHTSDYPLPGRAGKARQIEGEGRVWHKATPMRGKHCYC